MTVLNDEDRLTATQRYYNIVRSILVHGQKTQSSTCAVLYGDVSLAWGHSSSGSSKLPFVLVSFLLGEDEFIVDDCIQQNPQWDQWVKTQAIRCKEYERDQLLQEFMDFVLDYYPDYSV